MGLTLGFLAGIVASTSFFSYVIEGSDSTSSDLATSPANQVSLSVSPINPWVKPGETVTFALHADGDVGVSAAELVLRYGSDVEVVEVRPGPYLGRDTLAGPPLADEELHQAAYAWARIGDTPVQTPPGEVAFITMQAAEGYPWNTWVSAEVSLADSQFQKFQSTSLSFNLHVYDRLPVPIPVQPTSRFHVNGAPTGDRPVFNVKTLSPGTFNYKIEVSQDGFMTVLHTFDQTDSPEGWDKTEYLDDEIAEFVSPESLPPGQYRWRAYTWVQEVEQWASPAGRRSWRCAPSRWA
jgi:hypothetical protein